MPTTTITPVSETIFEVKIYTVDPDLAVLAAEAAASAATATNSANIAGAAASDAEEAKNIAVEAAEDTASDRVQTGLDREAAAASAQEALMSKNEAVEALQTIIEGDYPTMTEVQAAIVSASGFGNGGVIVPASVPPADAVNRTYFPNATGTEVFTNFSGISVTQSAGLTIIVGNSVGGFSKVVVPIDSSFLATFFEQNKILNNFEIGKNKFDISKIKPGYSFNGSGQEVVNASVCLTDYIRVNNGNSLYFSYANGAAISPRVVLYDRFLNILSVYVTYTNGTIINNSSAYYIRASIGLTVANNKLQIENGSITDYELYIKTLKDVKVKDSDIINKSKKFTGKTFIFFGDSITQDSMEDDHYSYYVEQNTGARCINVGFGGTSMTAHITPEFQAFGPISLLTAKLSGNYSTQEAAIEVWESGTPEEQLRAGNFIIQLNKLKAVDLAEVYACSLLYGANDHGSTVGTIDQIDPTGSTFIGAYNYVLKTLQENYPFLGIFILTPIYRKFLTEVTDRTPLFVQASKDIAKKNNLPVYDCYQNLGFNTYNFVPHYSLDGLHPTFSPGEGQVRMGQRISSFIESSL